MLMVGLLIEDDPLEQYNRGNAGLFKGGGAYLLGIQALGCLCIMAWAGGITLILLVVSLQGRRDGVPIW